MKDWSPNNSRQIMDKTGTLVLCLGEAFVGSILAHEKNLKYFQIKFLFGCIIRRNSNIVGEVFQNLGELKFCIQILPLEVEFLKFFIYSLFLHSMKKPLRAVRQMTE